MGIALLLENAGQHLYNICFLKSVTGHVIAHDDIMSLNLGSRLCFCVDRFPSTPCKHCVMSQMRIELEIGLLKGLADIFMEGTGAGCSTVWLGKGSRKHTCPVQRGG